MISQKLINQVQSCADKLTNDLVHALQSSPRCPSYRSIPPDRLIELKDDLYKNLGRWLGSRSKSAVETRYLKLGRERHLEGIPLCEVIAAQSITKAMLLNFIRRCMPGASEELNLEYELVCSISEFFDEVIYWLSVGYEDASQARLMAPPDIERRAPKPSRHLEPVAVGAEEMTEELSVSRGGDIGEASG
jgi:hypothetical protein